MDRIDFYPCTDYYGLVGDTVTSDDRRPGQGLCGGTTRLSRWGVPLARREGGGAVPGLPGCTVPCHRRPCGPREAPLHCDVMSGGRAHCHSAGWSPGSS